VPKSDQKAAFALPNHKSALDDRLAIVGTSGSGKTYAAGTAVERLLAAGNKVIIVDPLGTRWPGIARQGGRQTRGLPGHHIGGAHGDLPITPAAGALIGETVAGTGGKLYRVAWRYGYEV